MSDETTVTRNDARNRYELRLGDELIGRLNYRVDGDVIDMYHTEVDPAHGGKGYGNRIVAHAVADAADTGLTIRPTCPFIATYLDRHPEYADLRA